jgi:predicted Zn-dependent protease
MMFSQEFEAEADYVGMYFMARAGYDIDGVEEFWRRMSAENPRGIRLAYTHPNNAARFVGLAATGEEIASSQSAGLPLRPRMRGEPQVAPAASPADAAQAQAPTPELETSPAASPGSDAISSTPEAP